MTSSDFDGLALAPETISKLIGLPFHFLISAGVFPISFGPFLLLLLLLDLNESIEELIIKSPAELRGLLRVTEVEAMRVLKACSYRLLSSRGFASEGSLPRQDGIQDDQSGAVGVAPQLRESPLVQVGKVWVCLTEWGMMMMNPSFPPSSMQHRKMQWLTLGDQCLNEFLRGGILSRGITEIAGESATGKTQFCLQLCLTVQLPVDFGGLAGSAVYIGTEDGFPMKRLQQLIPHFKEQFGEAAPEDPGSQIHPILAPSLDQLDRAIHSQLPSVSSKYFF